LFGYLPPMNTANTRYHFNIIKPSGIARDLEGTELPSLEAARAHAIEDARVLMSMAILEGRDISGRTIEVTSEDGEVVLVLAFRDAVTIEGERS
jgi:hypothetical protein